MASRRAARRALRSGLKRFEVQLRLIDPRGSILQMAATGPMGASEFRYARPRG